jgi:hypothetical protein
MRSRKGTTTSAQGEMTIEADILNLYYMSRFTEKIIQGRQGKVKLYLCLNNLASLRENILGSVGIATLFLIRYYMKVSCQLQAPAALPPGK